MLSRDSPLSTGLCPALLGTGPAQVPIAPEQPCLQQPWNCPSQRGLWLCFLAEESRRPPALEDASGAMMSPLIRTQPQAGLRNEQLADPSLSQWPSKQSASTPDRPLCLFLRVCSPKACPRPGLLQSGHSRRAPFGLFTVPSQSCPFLTLLHPNLQAARCSASLGPLCTPRSPPDHMFLLLTGEWVLEVPVAGPRGRHLPEGASLLGPHRYCKMICLLEQSWKMRGKGAEGPGPLQRSEDGGAWPVWAQQRSSPESQSNWIDPCPIAPNHCPGRGGKRSQTPV